MDINDDGKLRNKWLNKKNNAKAEDIEFLLSYEQWCRLVEEAGLRSSDLGFSGKNFVLARFKDRGPYKLGNCRFITQKDNAAEKKPLTKTAIEKAVRSRAITRKKKMSVDPDYYKLTAEAKNKIRESAWHKCRIAEGAAAKAERFDNASPSHRGDKNSQFGTFWITDGTVNKKWSKEKGRIPKSFYKGRTV